MPEELQVQIQTDQTALLTHWFPLAGAQVQASTTAMLWAALVEAPVEAADQTEPQGRVARAAMEHGNSGSRAAFTFIHTQAGEAAEPLQ